MKRRALIVDDERLARVQLRRLLAAHPEVEVVGEAADVSTAAEEVSRLDPDLVFLDVQMPPATGFDVLEQVAVRGEVIFVTAHDMHALRAFEVNALDYLLKPVSEERLAQALARAREQGPAPEVSADALRPLEAEDRLLLAFGKQSRFVRVAEISCLTAADDYTELHLRSGASTLDAQPLARWEARLPPDSFARVHRNALVNLDAVQALQEGVQGQVVLMEGHPVPLPVSRRSAELLRRRFR